MENLPRIFFCDYRFRFLFLVERGGRENRHVTTFRAIRWQMLWIYRAPDHIQTPWSWTPCWLISALHNVSWREEKRREEKREGREGREGRGHGGQPTVIFRGWAPGERWMLRCVLVKQPTVIFRVSTIKKSGCLDTIPPIMITVLTRYRPIVFEFICSRNDCNFPWRRFFWFYLKP